MSIFAKAQNSWVVVAIRKLFRVELITPENEPDAGPYITCANHSSNWDPIVIGSCMHNPLRYMAKAELFKIPGLKSLITWFGAYPVNRQRADVSSIKTTINILEQGEIVGMYMQGGRRRGVHPRDITPKNGAAMIAVKAKSGVLPVTLIAKEHKMRAFRKTIVVFGRYIPYEELVQGAEAENKENKENKGEGKINENMRLYQQVTDKIYGEIIANYERYDVLNK